MPTDTTREGDSATWGIEGADLVAKLRAAIAAVEASGPAPQPTRPTGRGVRP
jgi:hypothetical protein